MTYKSFAAVALSAFLPLISVPGEAAKSKSKAAATTTAGAQTFTLDPAASRIVWVGKKVSGAHNGTVKLKSGEAQVQGDVVTGGQFEVDMTSIGVDDLTDPGTNQKLVGHLKSDDFFSVDKFPTASFKISRVEPLPATAGGPTHNVSGDLTVKGQTHPVTFPATITMTGGQATATASVVVDRTLYGIRYGSGKFFQNLGDKMIHDQFELQLNLVARPSSTAAR